MQEFLGKEALEEALVKHISKTKFLYDEYKREKSWGIDTLIKYYTKADKEYLEMTLCFPEKAFEYRVSSRFNNKTKAYIVRVRERVITLDEETNTVVITPSFNGNICKCKTWNKISAIY